MKIYSTQPKEQQFLPGMRRMRIRPTDRSKIPWHPGKIRHVGYKVERCRTSFMERVFAEQWIKINRYGSNDLLQTIFLRSDSSLDLNWKPPRLIIQPRDALVAATVIQWLGTNVGSGFVTNCLKLCGLSIERREGREWPHDAYYWRPGYKDVVEPGAWYNAMVKTRFDGNTSDPRELVKAIRAQQVDPMIRPLHYVYDLKKFKGHVFEKWAQRLGAMARRLRVPRTTNQSNTLKEHLTV